jgi:response regulator of citrate/malate metabolism
MKRGCSTKILVVDDDAAVLGALSRSFATCELQPEVFCAETAEETRDLLRKIKALDVIFLDKQLEC